MVPLGGALCSHGLYETCMTGPEHLVEFFHGYTYSGHPLACAAGLAALDVYREEGLFERARALAPVLEDAVHSLKGEPHVIDVRNYGMAAAIELAPRPGAPTVRAMEVFNHCFDNGAMGVPTQVFSALQLFSVDSLRAHCPSLAVWVAHQLCKYVQAKEGKHVPFLLVICL